MKKNENMETVEVELEIDNETLLKLNKLVVSGKYSSVETAIVSILTSAVNDAKKKKPKQPVGPKKMPNPTKRPSSRPPQRMPQRRGR